MQISRHWRLNANRYRLEGYNINNTKSVQARPVNIEAAAEVVQAAQSDIKAEKQAERQVVAA
ncbi:MAG: hypothetical protein MUF38_16075 [Anaerolineae bacterium]|jgi:hypothetical protein|nr:hypothetical protein [Anaerolineae bacterium]